MTATTQARLELKSTADPHRWQMAILPELCVGTGGRNFLFGGAALASAIMALECSCDAKLVWATAQFLSFAAPQAMLDLTVKILVAGRHSVQARVTGDVGGRAIISVSAALGSRPENYSDQWADAPAAPPPEVCEEAYLGWRTPGDIHDLLDLRLVSGRFGRMSFDAGRSADGRVRLWARLHGRAIDSAALAIIADLVPSSLSHATGRRAGGNSLDNTIRIRRIVATDWVLCDIVVDGVDGGFGHGRMAIFSRDRALMATASQSFIVRSRALNEKA